MDNFIDYYKSHSKEEQRLIRMELGIYEEEFTVLFENNEEYLSMIINYLQKIHKYYGFGLENII